MAEESKATAATAAASAAHDAAQVAYFAADWALCDCVHNWHWAKQWAFHVPTFGVDTERDTSWYDEPIHNGRP